MENGEKTEISLPTVIEAKDGEPLTLCNDGGIREDAGKTVSTRGAQSASDQIFMKFFLEYF